jgi:hypothetical protein
MFQSSKSMRESSDWYSTCSSLTISGIVAIEDLELTDELDLNNLFISTSFCLLDLKFYCFHLSTALISVNQLSVLDHTLCPICVSSRLTRPSLDSNCADGTLTAISSF